MQLLNDDGTTNMLMQSWLYDDAVVAKTCRWVVLQLACVRAALL